MDRFFTVFTRVVAGIFLVPVVATVAVGAWAWIDYERTRPEPAPVEEKFDKEVSRRALLNFGEDAVRKRLREPDTAKIEALIVAGDWICGYVNAKNGFGGYTGKMAFAVSGAVVLIEDGTTKTAKTIDKNCRVAKP
jgi:hypothetical protein